MALKTEVFAAAQGREPQVLASNTSAQSTDALAAGLARPEAFPGMHVVNLV